MALWIMSSVAVIATAGCFVLWFRDVRRIMREGASDVESARRQLVFWQKRASAAPGDPEAEGVLERREWMAQLCCDWIVPLHGGTQSFGAVEGDGAS